MSQSVRDPSPTKSKIKEILMSIMMCKHVQLLSFLFFLGWSWRRGQCWFVGDGTYTPSESVRLLDKSIDA